MVATAEVVVALLEISNIEAALLGSGFFFREVEFRVNYTGNASLRSVTVSNNLGISFDRIRLESRYNCYNPNRLSPCPVSDGNVATLNPAYSMTTANNRRIRIGLTRFPFGLNSLTIRFDYTSGCDELSITDF